MLPAKVGLFSLTGVNNDNTRLHSNGSGKSSLLDAICWCLFGKTTNGLRAGDVISWGCDSCSVSIEVIVANEKLIIKTNQNPNSVTLNGKTIERKALADRLRLNYESFLYSVIIPQSGNSFLDLTPAEKLTLFSQIMDLDVWLEKSVLAQEKSDKILLEIAANQNSISQLNGKVESTSSTIKELGAKSAAWADAQKGKIQQLKIQINNRRNQIEQHTLGADALAVEISKLEPNIKSISSEIEMQEKLLKGLNIETIDLDKELMLVDHKITDANDSKRRLGKVGVICPTCKQKVDKHHLNDEMSKIERLTAAISAEKGELAAAKNEVASDKSKLITIICQFETELTQLKSKATIASGNRDALLRENDYTKRDIDRLLTEISVLKDQKNEFEHMIEEKTEDLHKLHDQLKVKNEKIHSLNEIFAAVNYWVAGFKRLRLYIVEETLRSLEIEVNNSLASMGLTDWTIEFDIERENKSGGITKGFTTLIKNPDDEIIKYESLSGGEGQRVRLAGCFGLSNLIMERAGLINKIEFYDEVSQHLSDQGIKDMLDTLHDRAINLGRQIWVVEHRALDYPDFAGVVNVIKDENGSRIL